jgi:hypothetical protein
LTFSERRDTKRAYSIIVGIQLSSFLFPLCRGISLFVNGIGLFYFPGAVFCFLSRSSGIFFEIFGVKKMDRGDEKNGKKVKKQKRKGEEENR